MFANKGHGIAIQLRIAAVVFFARWPQPAIAADTEITVATFNLNYANESPRDMLATLEQTRADILFLQETTPDVERLLRRRFRGTHPYVVFMGHRNEYFAERSGVISRWPLRNLKFAPPVEGGLFGTLMAETSVHGQTVQLVNVHLMPFQVKRRTSVAAVMTAMGRTESVHQREATRLLERLNVRRPTLVCGDFNSLPDFKAPTAMKAGGLNDSYAQVVSRREQKPTWHWPFGDVNVQFRIDYVFHSDHFETRQSRVIESGGSDHYPVISQLRLQPARAQSPPQDKLNSGNCTDQKSSVSDGQL
ncbi:MAG: endonuclease/exonuclease/phosphatase family protein [Planctomycetaceae bacterium]|nr:endonuclease/exonuclease/phosphatase family protein [Planctomycetaceae bacterium]